ncbi:MAG: UvrB/UvrC motif-containing protein [Oscillospiraceae bacterium]|jgi:protein arginine kinase activator|nr:UvrB/UvrC motif-containing protein [Oscillospiraceae bacterium]
MYFIRTIPQTEPKPCPTCGITLAEISQAGRAGCPDCYTYFSERLTPYIRRVHGPAAHTGRIPRSAGAHIAKKRRLAELREQLNAAIERQEFEQCAKLRDEIAALGTNAETEDV